MGMKNKILILASTTGSIHSLRPECEIYLSMAENGYDITVLTQKDSSYKDRFLDNGIEVLFTDYNKKIDFGTIKKIRDIVKNKNIDIVYATSSKTISNGIIACIGLKTKFVTYRGTTGGLYWYDPSSWLNALNPRVNAILCVSDAVKDNVLKKTSFRKSLIISKIYKGHDINWYNNIKPLEEGKYGIFSKNLNVLFVGNVRRHKGFKYFVKTAYKFSQNKEVQFFAVGNGCEYNELPTELKKISKIANLNLLGFKEDALEIMKSCDVLIHPSFRKEGLSRVILEAMACNTPVISADNSANTEIVREGFNGYIVFSKNTDEIVKKLNSIIENPVLLEKLKENAMITVKEKFAYTETVKKYMDFFENINKLIN